MFDAAVAVTPNPLAGIILEPLANALVEDHKTTVVELFCAQSARNKALVKTKSAYWTRTIPTAAPYEIKCELTRFGAPQAVKTLALRVKREYPEAEFTVQWFYDDPILDVICDGEVMHLAIWDYGQVIAIAKTAPRRRWFHWFLRGG